jgi:hypothetical protein
MSLFRVAALLVMCGIALSAVGKSGTPQNSATKQVTKPDDIAKSIAESVSGTLQFAEGNFLGVAEAMPEDKYSYIPAGGNFDGVRSFGEQVKHVACAQFAFFNEFEGKKPPDDCEKGGHEPAETKAELIKYLKDSFDYSNRVLATLTANNALDRVEGRYAGPNTKTWYLGHCGLAHHRPLRTASSVLALERYRSTVHTEVRGEGSVSRCSMPTRHPHPEASQSRVREAAIAPS